MMKKYTIFLLLLASSLFACAQDALSTTKSNFRGGVRLGMSTSQISGDDLSGYHKLGCYGGGFVNVPVSKNGKWKLQMDLNVIMKGSSLYTKGLDDPNFGNKYVLTLVYTETPLLVKYNIIKGLEIEAGPSFNFKIAEKEIDGIGPLHRKSFNVFELAVIVGASYMFKEHWGVSLRWSSSIIPVRVPDWAIGQSVKKQFNDSLSLSAYYQF